MNRKPQPLIFEPPLVRTEDEGSDFRRAVDQYKKQYHRPWPCWSEVLEIARAIGLEKPSKP